MSRTSIASLGFALAAAGSALADTIRVPEDLPTIQQAIAAAAPGDQVLVAPGVYLEAIDLLGKPIDLRAEYGPRATIIDGSFAAPAPVVSCTSGETLDTSLEGFTIRNGSGGGVVVAGGALTMRRCRVVDNFALSGGGLALVNAVAEVDRCEFNGNVAAEDGGSIAAIDSTLRLSRSLISESLFARRGGGVFIDAGAADQIRFDQVVIACCLADDGGGVAAILRDGALLSLRLVTISDNDALLTGGGVHADLSSSALFEVRESTFASNAAELEGAGLWLAVAGASASLEHVAIEANEVLGPGPGGGMFVRLEQGAAFDSVNVASQANSAGSGSGLSISVSESVASLTNALHAFEGGAATELFVGNAGEIVIAHATIVDTQGGAGVVSTIDPGAITPGTIEILNSVIWGNSGGAILASGIQPVVRFSDVQGGHAGDGNFSLDPGLQGGFVPGPTSPLIGAADASLIPIDVLDIDDDEDVLEPLPSDLSTRTRASGPAPDIGSRERQVN